MSFRRAAKVDANQSQIVKALRRVGATVVLTHQLKNAFDILVCFRGVWTPLEIKDGAKLPKKFYGMPPLEQESYLYIQLTAGEKLFADDCKNNNAPYAIVYDINSSMKAIGAKSKNEITTQN